MSKPQYIDCGSQRIELPEAYEEMLEALQQLKMDCEEGDGPTTYGIDLMLSAIKNATGE